MGYFDGLTDAIFKKDPSGNQLFYPWGVLGSGFIIESEDQKKQIRSFFKRTYMIMLPVIVVMVMVLNRFISVALLLVYFVWYYFTIKKMTLKMKKTDIKLKIAESYQNSARSHNLFLLIFLALASLAFGGLGIFIIEGPEQSIFGYITIAFGLLNASVLFYMIYLKLRKKSS